jgi:hypothetical protein
MHFFDRFEKIYLWLDSDEIGVRSAEKFAGVLGSDRVIIIQPVDGPKDANDALKQGLSFKELMNQTARWRDESKIIGLSNIKDEIMHRFMNINMLQGTKS